MRVRNAREPDQRRALTPAARGGMQEHAGLESTRSTRRAADARARTHICAPRTSDLRYEQRALDILGVVVGRALVVERLVLLHVADAEGEHLLHGRPVGRD